MPLTPQERDQIIAQGSVAAAQTAIASLAPAAAGLLSSLALTGVIGLIGLPVAVYLYSRYRPRFPQISLESLTGSLREAEELRQRGLTPVIGTDPFTGNISIGTAEQDIPQLLRESFVREATRATPETTAEIFRLREELIETMKQSAVGRGFFPTTASIPPGLQGQFIRPTAGSPLVFQPLPEVAS